MYEHASRYLIARITRARRHMHHYRAGFYFTAYVLCVRTFGHVATLRQARNVAGLIIIQNEH
jgi:hypothetical protein